jgi:hypothetical protein
VEGGFGDVGEKKSCSGYELICMLHPNRHIHALQLVLPASLPAEPVMIQQNRDLCG